MTLKRLKLARPLVIFDLETTGTNVRHDRIVEIAAVKIFPDGRREDFITRVNPGRPIPQAAQRIHGIRDEDVRDSPTFEQIAPDLFRFFHGCDLAGFSVIRFDIPLLTEEFRRVGYEFSADNARVVDAQVIFHKKEPRNLSAALRFYSGEEHVDAHGAEADTLATLKVLEGQLERYPDLPDTVEALDQFCNPRENAALDPANRLRWNGDEVVLAFGEYAGYSLQDMVEKHPKYLEWILRKQFPEQVKTIIRDALRGKFPVPRSLQKPPPQTS